MEQWNGIDEVDPNFAETVVTIGKFDGVHLGHQTLIAEAMAIAEEHSLAAVLLTFDRNPSEVLGATAAVAPLTGPTQKADLVRILGIDALLTLEFNEQLATMTPENFVDEILVDALHAKAVVVGQGFRFGAGGQGDVPLLRLLGLEKGFVVREVRHAELDGKKISSTLIREALDRGDVVAASAMLGRNHVVRGVIEHGKKLGRTIGFPTANMSRSAEGYLPLDAVYSGWLRVCEPGAIGMPAALSVGINETFEAVPRVLEAYVLDRDDLDLYDLEVEIEFVDFVRPTLKFDSIDALIEAINADVATVREQIESSVGN